MPLPAKSCGEVIRVLVADSNQTQCQLLDSALRRQPGFSVASCRAEVSDCLSALELFPAEVVLVSDAVHGQDFPDGDRYELLRSIHDRNPRTCVILLLDSYDRDLVVNALRAGARGLFCRASQPFRALCKCIHAVRNGQIWTNNEQLSFVIEALTQLPSLHVINARGESLLTPREEEVVTLVAEGLTNRSIARQLRVTENTVKKSLLRIFDKLGISNRVELVLYALTERKTTEPDTSTNSEDAPRMETRSSGVAEPPGRAFRPGLRSLELVTVESAS